jgi:serine/threonine-protein kinase
MALTTGASNEGDLWVYDVGGRPPTPLTYEGHNIHPVWHPDGVRVAFASDRETGIPNLFWIPADGSTLEPERLLMSGNAQFPSSWTVDGRELLFRERRSDETRSDILAMPIEGARDSRVVVGTPYFEGDARLSPGGRWLAYVSDVTGRDEVWVRPFPGPGPPTRVTLDGGIEPVWAHDGRELFYLSLASLDETGGSPRLMGVPIVETEPELTFGPSRVVIDGGFVVFPGAAGFYDVAPDGRFVMISAAVDVEADAETEVENADIVLVQHFFEELTRLVPSP